MSEKRFVYADNAATTPVHPEVFEAMKPYLTQYYGNPSSIYSIGREMGKTINDARAKIASLLDCRSSEIFFTASGSEADNWAIKGAAHSAASKGKHIITTKFEHHAVLNSMKSLEKEGFEVTYLDVDHDGQVSCETLQKALRPDTTLVCIMFANNEIGSVLPIKDLAAAAHKFNPDIVFFTDAVQAVGHIPIDLKDLGVDMLSMSGHKINAPKGTGALYIKTGTKVQTLIDGGGQERGRRGGTENIAGIVALATALESAVKQMPDMERVKAMRDRLAEGIIKKIPYSFINGGMKHRLPGNLNVSFEFVEGESLLLWMDMNGICVSTGSACSSASLKPSHVLLSIGVPVEKAHGSMRISLGHDNTDEDVDYILECLPKVVDRLRAMSPLYANELEKNKKQN